MKPPFEVVTLPAVLPFTVIEISRPWIPAWSVIRTSLPETFAVSPSFTPVGGALNVIFVDALKTPKLAETEEEPHSESPAKRASIGCGPGGGSFGTL